MIREPADQILPLHIQALLAFGISFCLMAIWLELVSR